MGRRSIAGSREGPGVIGQDRARVSFGRPDVESLAEDGYRAVDMHVHSSCSDAAPSVRQILKVARRRRIGVAITDHNEVRGVRGMEEADLLAIPGIELDCAEGPHILLYFYSSRDLVDFYDRHLRERRRGAQYMTAYPTAAEILSIAGGYACLKVAAHPFGYFGLDRGVLKCAGRNLLPGVLDRLDGFEAICGGMTPGVNRLAAAYAATSDLPVTGGSDAHILREVGSVVTGVRAGSVEEFLDGIRAGESIVVGSSSGFVSRGLTAGVIACNYVPYGVTALSARIGPRAARLGEVAGWLLRPR